MFNYSLRTKLNLLILLAVLLTVLVFLAYRNQSQTKDLKVLSQAQVLGTALERYYSKYRAYPSARRISADQIKLITENGINQEGKFIYYRQSFYFAKEVTLVSTEEEYALEFKVDNGWPVWGAERGSLCRLKNGLKLECQPSK